MIHFLNDNTKLTVISNCSIIIKDYCTFIGNGASNFLDIQANTNIEIGSFVSFLGEPYINNWFIDIDAAITAIFLDYFQMTSGHLSIITSVFQLTNSSLYDVELDQYYSFTDAYIYNNDFMNSSLTFYAGKPELDDCNFEVDMLNNCSEDYFLMLDNCQEFSVKNCTLVNARKYGIEIHNSGNGEKGIHEIKNNLITYCGFQNVGTAVLIYNSSADIHDNIKFSNNHYGIQSLNGSNVSIIGNRQADYVHETQQICNNYINQVYASKGAFPYEVRWNAFYYDVTNCLFMYDTNDEEPPYDVKFNYWGTNFNPQDDLCPSTIYYSWLPVWDLQMQSPAPGTDGQMFYASQTLADSGNYTQAQTGYQQLVSTYPASKYAIASLKELFSIEQGATNDYALLKNYYSGIVNQQTNDELVKIAGFLSNLCDIKLENYQTAIAHYESVIQSPPSFADSLFAIIDLGNLYVQMGNDSLKSVPIGNMPEYKPVSQKQHSQYRDYLLSLLFKDDEISEENQQSLHPSQGIAALLPNYPNPFSGQTTLGNRLDEDATITINVYDYTGRMVKSFAEGYKEIGEHHLTFTPNNLVSGIYFCYITANGSLCNAQKIILQK